MQLHSADLSNALAAVRLGTDFDISDVQKIAMMIVDPASKGLNDYWTKAAYSLVVSTALHCLYQAKSEGRTATVADMARCLANPNMTIKENLESMVMTRHKDGLAHPEVAWFLHYLLNASEQERSGVVSTAVSLLPTHRDPTQAANCHGSQLRS